MRFAALLVVILVAASARADRAPKDRDTAKYVLEGVVETVEKSIDGEYDWYVISLRVEKVAKGDGVKAGDLFKVTCYRWVRAKPKSFGSAGHDQVPAKGDAIKAFVSEHATHGGREAVYPDWLDKLDAGKKK